jgi:hypothetical protein
MLAGAADDGRFEVIDVLGKTETVDAGDDDAAVDLNSASEGDGRTMASEDGNAGDVASADRSGDGAGRRNDRGTRDTRQRTARADDADGDESFSARTRKRIARERALVNRERVLREQAQRELADERTARQADSERITRLERASTEIAGNATVKDLESQIAAIKPQLEAALEGGQSAQAADLTDKISDLKAKLGILKYDLAQKQRQAEAEAAARTNQQATRAAVGTTSIVDNPEVKELAQRFRRANRHWWNRSAHTEAKADAINIDCEILNDIKAGELEFEPYSDEHLEELARRLHEFHPALEIQDADGQPYPFDEEGDEEDMNDKRDRNGGTRQNDRQQTNTRQNRGTAPVSRMGQGGRRAPSAIDLARQGKVELDANDFATMRTFKMDPNSATDKKYFAREKMRSIISGQRGNTNGGNR